MGVDCWVYLKPTAAARDVADAIAITCGAEVAQPRESYGRPVRTGAHVENSPVVGCVDLVIPGGWRILFQYDAREDGHRAFSLGSPTPGTAAIARVLVDFFGGYADLNDFDKVERDVEAPGRWGHLRPHDGAAWQQFEDELAALPAVPEAVEHLNRLVRRWLP